MPLTRMHFSFEAFDDDAYGIVAVAGDVQVGWCRQHQGGWCLFDMDEQLLGGSFADLQAAETACSVLLAHMAGGIEPRALMNELTDPDLLKRILTYSRRGRARGSTVFARVIMDFTSAMMSVALFVMLTDLRPVTLSNARFSSRSDITFACAIAQIPLFAWAM